MQDGGTAMGKVHRYIRWRSVENRNGTGRWGRVVRIGSVDSSKSCATDVLKSQIEENERLERRLARNCRFFRSGARPVKILFCPPVSGPPKPNNARSVVSTRIAKHLGWRRGMFYCFRLSVTCLIRIVIDSGEIFIREMELEFQRDINWSR